MKTKDRLKPDNSRAIKNKTGTYRTLMILKLLLLEPDVYKIKHLAAIFKVSNDSVKNDFYVLKSAGFKVVNSGWPDYVYSIENIKEFDFKELLVFKENISLSPK